MLYLLISNKNNLKKTLDCLSYIPTNWSTLFFCSEISIVGQLNFSFLDHISSEFFNSMSVHFDFNFFFVC